MPRVNLGKNTAFSTTLLIVDIININKLETKLKNDK